MAKMSQQKREQGKRIAELEQQLAERETELAETLAQLAETSGASPAAAKKAAKAPAGRLAQSQVNDVPGAGDPAPEESGQS